MSLTAAYERTESLEEELNDVKCNLDSVLKEKEMVAEDLNLEISRLQSSIDQLNLSNERETLALKNKLEELQEKVVDKTNALTVKEEEFKLLKNSLKQIKGKAIGNLDSLFDVCRVKAELSKVEIDKKLGVVNVICIIKSQKF